MNDNVRHVTRDLVSSAIKYVVGGLAGLLISALIVFLKHFFHPLYNAIINDIPKDAILQGASIIALVALISFVWIALLYRERRTPLADKYNFDEYGGFYVDPKNDRAVCPSCLSDGKIVHMMDVSGNKMCNACKTTCRGKREKTG